MTDIPLFKVFMAPSAADAVAGVLNSGYIGQGPKVEEFEEALRAYMKTDRVVTVNSATSGLTLALRLFEDEIRQDGYDGEIEVLTTPLTCTATNWPILASRMDIKWVDVNPNNFNLDLDDLERKLSPSTRIITVVHWGGQPVDLDRLQEIQDKAYRLYGYRPWILQDCAHAFGSLFRGEQVGSYGLPNSIAVYSFQAIKHLTSVDGGMMIVPEHMLRKAKLLRWYGIDRDSNRKDFRCEADVPEFGYKFHMNDVNATVGIENLKVIDPIVEQHKANRRYYDYVLEGADGVELLELDSRSDSACWIYSMKVEDQSGFMDAMKDRGIIVSRVHERNDKHTCVASYVSALPSLDALIKKMICIPSGWWVKDEDREYIAEAIRRGW